MNNQLSKSSLLYNEGREFLLVKDYGAAIERFKESADIFPHFKTLELLGECFLEQEKYSQAIIYLAAACELGNKSFRSYFLLAKAFFAFGETNDARNKLERALELNPNYKAAQNLLAELTKKIK